jgi:hypothetical protein
MMGSADLRTRLPHEVVRKDAFGFYGTTIEFTRHGLHRDGKDERTVTTACLKSAKYNDLLRTFGYKNRHERTYLITRADLQPKAGYSDTDSCSSPSAVPHSHRARSYIVFTDPGFLPKDSLREYPGRSTCRTWKPRAQMLWIESRAARLFQPPRPCWELRP